MDWLPRLKIYRSSLDGAAFTAARRGTLAHLCLEHLLLTRPRDAAAREEDVARAVRMGMRLFPLPVEHPEDVGEDMRACLSWFAAQPFADHWLRHGRREQSLLDSLGGLHRVDLLVEETGGPFGPVTEHMQSGTSDRAPFGKNSASYLLAVDYKTGYAP